VLLSRQDILKQAVSLSIASQTGVWISGQKPVNENPEYSFKHIDNRLRKIILDNSSWRYTLAASGCNYIEMGFDQVSQDLFQSIKKIAKFMSLELYEECIPKEQVTRKQSNNRNKEWEDKFISDFDKSSELLENARFCFIERLKIKIKQFVHNAKIK
jgi:LPS sulfotransferase NodH